MAELLKTKATIETLFVGVGGVGSDVVAKVAGMCKGAELDNIRFVVMDTDANSLKTIAETGAIITKVQTSTSLTVKEYLEKDEDARVYWFPNNSTLYGKTVSEGAGQVRAISRLALNNAIRTGEINKLYKEIDNLLLKDSGDFKQALRVVIVSSATGGTGSGMAMITAMLIREYLHEHYSEKKSIIRGFFVLPSVMDTVIDNQVEKESQYRNGYATIKEINAFMMIASGFGGTEETLKRYNDIHITVPTSTGGTKELSCLPFDFCFLLEAADKNSEGLGNLEAYKDSAALCVYEQSVGPMQAKSFSLEDNIVKEFSQKNKFARNRFGGIGASKIVYPYEDIADYVAYSRALRRIGGVESSGDWSAYDKAYDQDMKEYTKRRSFTDDTEPSLETSYISALERDNSLFAKDIKEDICGSENIDLEVDELLESYISALEEYVVNEYKYSSSNANYSLVDRCKSFKYEFDQRDQTGDDLDVLQNYDSAVRSAAYDFGKNIGKSIFYSSPNISSDAVKEFNVENLIRKKDGACHPNSVRYILYKLTLKLAQRHDNIKSDKEKCRKDLKIYSAGYTDEESKNTFDVDAKFSSDKENNINALVEFAKQQRSVFDKMQGGFDSMWEKVNNHMHRYASLLIDYTKCILCDAVYTIAEKYLDSVNKEYESFFRSFSAKAVTLNRNKESIVESLGNVKGSNVYYLCATEDKLDEICKRTAEGRQGFLLPAELSAKIFENVKKNAELRRIREYDKYAEGRYIDIFDSVLIDFFRNQVREEEAEKLDINIVKAIFLDKELGDYLDNINYGKIKSIDDVRLSESQKQNELIEALRKGRKLAAPGINGQNFVEPREVKICTFSDTLLDMRDIKIKQFIEGQKVQAIPSETVSKYEMRFFNAIYNVSPDEIPLFKGPQRDRVTGGINTYETGIYFKAYQEYGKLIGPDSMKSSTISTHIDKRWDAIVELPEIDFDVQYDEIRKSHVALICGLVLGLIRKFPSTKYDKKRVFKIIGEDGDQISLTVSNGTECDEFYEILDALYRDKENANMLIEAAEGYNKNDMEKNYTYNQSAFVRFLNSFRIPDSHNNPTSLFEIPLVYYNSLPSAMTDNNEISIMIDAVIYLLETVVKKLERAQDQNAYLCKLLEEQFELLVSSFNNDEFNKKFNLRKNTEIYDNIVISKVSQKIIKKLKEVDVSDCADRIDAIRMVTREPESLYE